MRNIKARQFDAFLLAGATAPAALLCARASWQWSLLGGAVVGLILYSMHLLVGGGDLSAAILRAWGRGVGRWVLLAELAWLAVLFCAAARAADAAFPDLGRYYVFAAALILLTASAVSGGVTAPVRVGAVLLPFLLALYAVIAAFSAPEIRPDRLASATAPFSVVEVMGALLPLSLGLYLRGQVRGSGKGGWFLVGLALLAAVSMVTVGSMGAALAAELEVPLYRAVQSVSLFGVMERFEILLSAALTAGLFCQLCLVALAGGEILRRLLRQRDSKKTSLLLPALGLPGILLAQWIPAGGMLLGNLIFCGVLPLATLLLGARKKPGKKDEKGVDKGGSRVV